MIKVDQFCFGCDLKTGAIIIGVAHLILGILSVSVALAGASGSLGDRLGIYDIGFLGILDILAALTLLYGTVKRDPSFLMLYLVVIPFEVAVSGILLLLTAIFSMLSSPWLS